MTITTCVLQINFVQFQGHFHLVRLQNDSLLMWMQFIVFIMICIYVLSPLI